MWADQMGGEWKKQADEQQARDGFPQVRSNTVCCTVPTHRLTRYLKGRGGRHALSRVTQSNSASNSAASPIVERRRANGKGNSYATQTVGQGL